MHFSGMSAMRLNAVMRYDLTLFILSIIAAIGLGIAALFAQNLKQGLLGFKKIYSRYISSSLMGLAITSMHYTAMKATYYFPAPIQGPSEIQLNPLWLSIAVGSITTLIIMLAIAATIIDQRLQSASRLVGVTRQRLVEAIESISDGFVLIDKNGKIAIFNDRYREYSSEFKDLITPGVSYEELIRASIERGRHPESVGNEEEYVQNRLHEMATSMEPFERKLPNGRWLLISHRHTKNGEIVGIRTDITALKKREAELIEAKEKAELSDRAKSEFLAHMSHELRTPLNSIIGYSQMITEEVYGKVEQKKYLEYAEDIHNSGYHLLHLINDVLDLSKIEARELELHESDIDIQKLLKYCMRMIQGRKDSAELSIRFQPFESSVKIRGDEMLLKQVIINLLSNAVKYNIVNGTVYLSATIDPDNSIIFKITDTGVGIAQHDIAKVLEPFGQARQDAHKSHEGTGLGLSLSKQLTELHGGSLTLESKLGSGTTAFIKFPPERTVHL